MGIRVKKYGGSSVADTPSMQRVADQIIRDVEAGDAVVVVVSAPGSLTDELLAQSQAICPNPSRREKDVLLSVGEQISIALLTMALKAKGYEAVSLTGGQAGIKTNGEYGRARITEVDTQPILTVLSKGKIAVVAGFQGLGPGGELTTLGRGGSDTTAVALAAALDASCEIWTDVDGVYSAHPRIVPQCQPIPTLGFEEMIAMAESGAAVLKSGSVELAKRHQVELTVGSSFTGQTRSRIIERPLDCHRAKGVTLEEDLILVSLWDSNSALNFQLISQLAAQALALKTIWERGRECSLMFKQEDLAEALDLIKSFTQRHDLTWSTNDDLAILSVVGAGINFGTDVMNQVLSIFAQMQIQPAHYFFTEMRIAFAIQKEHGTSAVRLIYQALVADGNLAPMAAKADTDLTYSLDKITI